MPVAYYHVEDPIENLKIRINVREMARPLNFGGMPEEHEYFNEEISLSWQQKLYSPSEIADYIRHKDSRVGTVAQFETRRHFARLEKIGNHPRDLLTSTMLYTYVDKDHYTVNKPPPLDSNSSQETYLGKALDGLGGDYQGNKRQRQVAQRFFRDKPFRMMYVCLATDIDEEGILDPNLGEIESYFVEHILCSFKLYQDGLLAVDPGFSGIVEEPIQETDEASIHSNRIGLSPFLTDRTAEAAIKTGFRLTTFRVSSLISGSEFEYSMENVNDVLSPIKLESILKHDNMVRGQRVAEYRGDPLEQAERQKPFQTKHKTLGIYTELVEAVGFDSEKLYISYEWHLPTQWHISSAIKPPGEASAELTTGEEGSKADTGVLENSIGKKQFSLSLPVKANNMSNIGFATPTALLSTSELPSGESNGLAQLQGMTQVAIAGTPMRQAQLIYNGVSRHRWVRGLFRAHSSGAGSQLILGSAFFVFAVLSVTAGINYPFWILPALVIFFVLGSGTPNGASEVVRKGKKVVVEGLLEPRAVFNHLMSYTVTVKESLSDTKAEKGFKIPSSPSSEQATLYIQVHSLEWRETRRRLVGYGHFTLPDRPGMFDTRVSTWRPAGTHVSRMHDFFLGNAVRLKHEDSPLLRPSGKEGALNRFGVLGECGGTIRIRGQIIAQDPRMRGKGQALGGTLTVDEEGKVTPAPAPKVKRSVEEILRGLRSSSAGGGALQKALAGGAGKPSLASLMNNAPRASLVSAPEQSQVADILARARAKVRRDKALNQGNPNTKELELTKPNESALSAAATPQKERPLLGIAASPTSATPMVGAFSEEATKQEEEEVIKTEKTDNDDNKEESEIDPDAEEDTPLLKPHPPIGQPSQAPDGSSKGRGRPPLSRTLQPLQISGKEPEGRGAKRYKDGEQTQEEEEEETPLLDS